ncbi:hypothetical protein Htur_2453 [Haloterrigena turkmenica DSM 5511]|uniref:Uncharacterized protein n=1 Tax=Haloterrigena turkmenica (strain ATCC 51198 / DSM 5511 / JCM 9101 / NCIMB 13204 / VKM B-1734 / 4k) TaxID=543526 RepID=D2RVD0_HALTV|nr:hypothetical protein [Haloterrigena turkmenica]ADB61331.1 hypothetical protein Htur_2453 [Haloterrigena turkmenica DSM 5511]
MPSIEPRLLPVAIVLLLVPVSAGCLYYAVYKDAMARGANAIGWGAAVFLLPPIGGPAYAVYRRRLPDRTDPPGRTERVLGAVGIGGITAVLFSTSITPPDPYSTAPVALLLFVVLVPLAAIVCYDVDPRTFGHSES